MENSSQQESLRRYLVILRRWAWLLLIAGLLSGGSALYFSLHVPPTYQSSATVLVSAAPATAATDYNSLRASEGLASTYAELLTKGPVLEQVIENLGLPDSPSALEKDLQVRKTPDTQLITVRVQRRDPAQAAAIANAIVAVFNQQNQALQTARYAGTKANLESQLADLDAQIAAANQSLDALSDQPFNKAERDRLEALLAQYRLSYTSLLQSYEEVRMAEAANTSNLDVVEPARPNPNPVAPKILLMVLVATLFGLFLSGILVLTYEFWNDTLQDPEQALAELGLPVLGWIIRHHPRPGEPITMAEPRSPVAEAFRSVRTNLQYSSVDHPLKTILVTSPSPEEGKSSVAANLAVALAQSNRRVVLIDGDLRRPTLHKIFGLYNRHGLGNLFLDPRPAQEGQINLNGTVQNLGAGSPRVITSGNLPPNPAELLASERMAAILQLLAKHLDYVVLDSPPVLAVTDAVALASRVDGVVLVVKPGFTKLRAAQQAITQLHHVGANLLGVVLNDVDHKQAGYYYYYPSYYDTQVEPPRKSPNGKKPELRRV